MDNIKCLFVNISPPISEAYYLILLRLVLCPVLPVRKGKRKNQSSGTRQNQADSPRTENDGRQAQVKLGREQDGAKSNSKPPI